MSTRNVTLSLPEDLVRRAKVLAAERDTSMSALVGDLLAQVVGVGRTYEELWRDENAVMVSGPLRVANDMVSRDQLHQR